jgi:hypothetical protein
VSVLEMFWSVCTDAPGMHPVSADHSCCRLQTRPGQGLQGTLEVWAPFKHQFLTRQITYGDI